MQEVTCSHSSVLDDGRITCQKIAGADNEASPDICRHCPAAACGCDSLKFSLEKVALTAITVRWANGHAEVWNDQPPHVSFLRSSCVLSKAPVSSPAECLVCSLRESPPTTSPNLVAFPGPGLAAKDNVIPFVRRHPDRSSLPSTCS